MARHHPLHTAWLADEAAAAMPAPPRARTALDFASATVRTVAPARWLSGGGLLAPDPGEPKARYTDSAHTNVRNTMARVRKQLRIQEQPKEADAA